MPLDDIKALAVADIATPDAVLFLWALPHMVHKRMLARIDKPKRDRPSRKRSVWQ